MLNQSLKIFFVIDFIVILFAFILGDFTWVLNTQVAFFSSLAVTVGSYLGYRKNIQSRVQNHINEDDNYDEIDKMDDKYDLYSPEVPQEEVKENPTKEEIKEAMKPIKQNHFANFKSGFSGMASLYRLAGYVGLVLGFFYLNNNGYLHIYSYVFGFIIVPISALVISFILKKESN
jgi:biopolymer transport protein ExbB/TolQ